MLKCYLTNKNIKLRIFRITFIRLIILKSVGSDIDLLLFNKYRRSTKYCIIRLLGDNVQFIPDIHTCHTYNSIIALLITMSITFICIDMCPW